MKPPQYRLLFWLLFGFGTLLRVVLFWANPPSNAYDNHFKPIFFILQYDMIPPKAACSECFQPPLFYYLSAQVSQLLALTGVSNVAKIKVLQFMSCLFSVANLAVVYLILKKLPLSVFSRLVAFGTVCFLPRDIYMSAMHSNDTLAALLVSCVIYVLFETLDRSFSLRWLIVLSSLLTLALLTKYNTMIVLPATAAVFGVIAFKNAGISRKKMAILFSLVMIIPMIFWGGQAISDKKNYDMFFATNLDILGMRHHPIPGREDLSFLTFKPWAAISSPVISPGNVDSFWTLIYGRMWFDMEPRFLTFTDHNDREWGRYFDYLNGDSTDWPGIFFLRRSTLLTGGALLSTGIIPLILGIYGLAFFLTRRWYNSDVKPDSFEATKVSVLLIIFICNAAGIALSAWRYPYYHVMKAAFFLPSLSSFAFFLGLGVMAAGRHRRVKVMISLVFMALYVQAAIHVATISLAYPSLIFINPY